MFPSPARSDTHLIAAVACQETPASAGVFYGLLTTADLGKTVLNIAQQARLAWLLMAFAVAATALVYWTGLQGPFLLDDEVNLRSIPEWLDGKLGLYTLVFDRGAGMFGRPLSMASFAFNSLVGGYAPFSLKVGNLIAHLLCGLAIFCFLRLLLRRDPLLQPRASLYAAVVASLWLLHPLHASTVLYVVQRMAQLSTLFILLGLWLYVALRQRLVRGPSLVASAGLLLGLPVMTALAFLSKENGILLPLLCAAVELAYFSGTKRPGAVRAFHLLYVGLPALAGMMLFTLKPERIIGGYTGRDFTFAQRMLTQPRALCDYLWKLVVPNPPRMGVYTDDFVASTGLLQPSTTLIAILAISTISIAAWHWRKSLPGLFFGWFFFLAAHALEAGPIPLELYFEHRNYLPAVGILIALLVLTVAAGNALERGGLRPGRIGVMLAVGIFAVLAFGTHGRAKVWRSERLIAESSLLAHPYSLRANVAVMTSSIRDGDLANAKAAIERLISSPIARHRSLGHSFRLLTECEFDHRGRREDLEAFVTQSPLPLTLSEAQPFNLVYFVTAKQDCGGVPDPVIGHALAQLADRAKTNADTDTIKIRIRYQSASFLLRANQWRAALEQAKLAWQPNSDTPIALPLVLSQLHVGDIKGAKQTLREVEARADMSNAQEKGSIDWLRKQIDSAELAYSTGPANGN